MGVLFIVQLVCIALIFICLELVKKTKLGSKRRKRYDLCVAIFTCISIIIACIGSAWYVLSKLDIFPM